MTEEDVKASIDVSILLLKLWLLLIWKVIISVAKTIDSFLLKERKDWNG